MSSAPSLLDQCFDRVLREAPALLGRSLNATVAALQDEGIDLAELVRLSESTEVRGTLVEVDGNERNERVIISME